MIELKWPVLMKASSDRGNPRYPEIAILALNWP